MDFGLDYATSEATTKALAKYRHISETKQIQIHQTIAENAFIYAKRDDAPTHAQQK